MSRKFTDMNAEQEVSNFLEGYFYPWLSKDVDGLSTQRNIEKQLQIKGIDVILKYKGKEYYVDEKAQLYYMNKNLPTFAFEVSFINKKNELSVGWLINDDLLTNYYFLIWLNASTDNIFKVKAKDFTKLDCLMIRKRRVKEYLESKGWSSRRIFEKSIEIRNNTSRGKINIQGENEFYFYFSDSQYYSEQPINIVIRKNVLICLAEQHYCITKSEVTTMK